MTLTALTCSGDISTTTENLPLCSGNWVLTQLPQPFDISQLDPVVLSQMLITGFAISAGLFGLIAGCRVIIYAIKKF